MSTTYTNNNGKITATADGNVVQIIKGTEITFNKNDTPEVAKKKLEKLKETQNINVNISASNGAKQVFVGRSITFK